jgi:hypothetical protein
VKSSKIHKSFVERKRTHVNALTAWRSNSTFKALVRGWFSGQVHALSTNEMLLVVFEVFDDARWSWQRYVSRMPRRFAHVSQETTHKLPPTKPPIKSPLCAIGAENPQTVDSRKFSTNVILIIGEQNVNQATETSMVNDWPGSSSKQAGHENDLCAIIKT